jgi:hypothetical protein
MISVWPLIMDCGEEVRSAVACELKKSGITPFNAGAGAAAAQGCNGHF